MIAIGIDPSVTNTGVALLDDLGYARLLTADLARRDAHEVRYLPSNVINHLRGYGGDGGMPRAVIGIERPYMGLSRKGSLDLAIEHGRWLESFLQALRSYYFDHTDVVQCSPLEWQSYVLGVKGRTPRAERKKMSVEYVTKKYKQELTHDAADAVCIAEYAMATAKVQMEEGDHA
jgi:Holliday junction resolvasome RuvABC endonuclease subunit